MQCMWAVCILIFNRAAIFLLFAPNADLWTQICNSIVNMSINTNIQLIQYMVLHRAQWTQHKLFEIEFRNSALNMCCSILLPKH